MLVIALELSVFYTNSCWHLLCFDGEHKEKPSPASDVPLI